MIDRKYAWQDDGLKRFSKILRGNPENWSM